MRVSRCAPGSNFFVEMGDEYSWNGPRLEGADKGDDGRSSEKWHSGHVDGDDQTVMSTPRRSRLRLLPFFAPLVRKEMFVMRVRANERGETREIKSFVDDVREFSCTTSIQRRSISQIKFGFRTYIIHHHSRHRSSLYNQRSAPAQFIPSSIRNEELSLELSLRIAGSEEVVWLRINRPAVHSHRRISPTSDERRCVRRCSCSASWPSGR